MNIKQRHARLGRALDLLKIAVSTSVLMVLSGCGERVIVYTPGEYKGQIDPLVEKSGSPLLNEELRARFEQVQARQ
ncbi:MAG: hypothetical protein WBN31_06035 [Gammaproteobacteria bacterium]